MSAPVEPLFGRVWEVTHKAQNQLIRNRIKYERDRGGDPNAAEVREAIETSRQFLVIKALRAAMTPHKVIEYQNHDTEEDEQLCQTCGTTWPCETVENIINALDGKEKQDVGSE